MTSRGAAGSAAGPRRLARLGSALLALGTLLLLLPRDAPAPSARIVVDPLGDGLAPSACAHVPRTRGLEKVASACNCTATSWCSLVCACPSGPSSPPVWSACDLSLCDHVDVAPRLAGGGALAAPHVRAHELMCRSAAPDGLGVATCRRRQPPARLAPPAAAPAAAPPVPAPPPSPSASAPPPPGLASNPFAAPARSAAGPFEYARVYTDGLLLEWTVPPRADWCVRALAPDGSAAPVDDAGAAGGGAGSGSVSGCGAQLQPSTAAIGAARGRHALRCVVRGLQPGVEWRVALHARCAPGSAGELVYEAPPMLVGPAGAQCGGADDQRLMFGSGWLGGVNQCGHSCWGKGACSADCLRKLGLSKGCAKCWGDVVGCGAWHCWNTCMFGQESDRCKQCGREHCQADFAQCVGDVPMPEDA